MVRDSTVIAVFERKKFTLTVNTTLGGITDPSGPVLIDCDSIV